MLFGFNLWIPTNLRKLGFTDADAMLRNAALMGFPLSFVVAWLYGFWSSKKTMILLTALTAAALFAFALAGDVVLQNRWLLYVLLVIPIWGISSVVAVLSVYSSEIYPTRIRSRGTGLRRRREQGRRRGDHLARRRRHRAAVDRDGRADRRGADGDRRGAARDVRGRDPAPAARGNRDRECARRHGALTPGYTGR